MNQTPNAQRPLLLAFLLGGVITLLMGMLVLRMENRMLNQGTTGFEGGGGLLVLALSMLAVCVVGVLFWVNSASSETDRSLQWRRLYTKGSALYFFIVFLIGFRFGPAILSGNASVLLMVVMLVVLAGLGVFFFAGERPIAKSFAAPEEE